MISVGDVVQLRSGGPKMTVVDFTMMADTGVVKDLICAWVDLNNAPQEGSFPKRALRLIAPYIPTPSDPGEQEEEAKK